MSTELLDLCFLISQDLPGVRQSLAKQASQPVSPDLCFPAPSPGKHSPRCSMAYARSGEIWMHLKHILPSNSAGSSANREKEAHCSELWQQWASLDPLPSPRTAPYQNLLELDSKKVSTYGKWVQLCTKWLRGERSNRAGALNKKRCFSGFPVLKQYLKFASFVYVLATQGSLRALMLHWFFALFD